MDSLELIYRLSVALAVGLLIGIERGWKTREEREGERAAGLRTLTLTGLLGGATAAVGLAAGNAALVIGLAFPAVGLLIGFFRYREMAHDQTFGATTVIAALIAYVLGALAVIGEPVIAAAAAVAATALLALKSALHAWLRRLTWEELRAGIVLLAMTLILLPMLPNHAMGPFSAINPYELWFMTILIAAVSFVGYVAMKWVGGRHGVAVSGIAGGLASSTAVTLAFSRLAREHPDRRHALVGATLLAGAVMLLRILLVTGAVNPGLLRWLVPPLLMAALGTAGLAAWHLLRREGENGDAPIALKNPFEIATVLKFGAFLAVIMVTANAATAIAGEHGVFALAALSGIADVDAITLTMSRLAGGGGLAAETAAAAILLAAAVNTIAKTALAWFAGGAAPGLAIAVGAVLTIALGIAGFALAFWDPFATLLQHPLPA